MKKFILALLSIGILGAVAHASKIDHIPDTPAGIAGKSLCHDVIWDYSQGSTHLSDCLHALVLLLAEKTSQGMSLEPNEIVDRLCRLAGTFDYSASFDPDHSIEGQCFEDALEQGLLPKDYPVPQFN